MALLREGFETTLAHSFHRNSAGVEWRVVLVKQNPTDFSEAFFFFFFLMN